MQGLPWGGVEASRVREAREEGEEPGRDTLAGPGSLSLTTWSRNGFAVLLLEAALYPASHQ